MSGEIIDGVYNGNGAMGVVPAHKSTESNRRHMEYKGKGRNSRVGYVASKSAMELRTVCPECRGKLSLTRKHDCFEDFVCTGCKKHYELNIISEKLTEVSMK